MGIFSGIKNRIFGRRGNDYNDIRSGVLDEPMLKPLPPEPGEPVAEEPKFKQGFGDVEPPKSDVLEPFSERGPVGFEPPNERGPIDIGPQESREGGYEVVDKLNFIENQLSAIKSQTETINERLKNIEMKLGRRY